VDFPPRFPFDFDDHAKDVSLANANINIVHSFVVALAFGWYYCFYYCRLCAVLAFSIALEVLRILFVISREHTLKVGKR